MSHLGAVRLLVIDRKWIFIIPQPAETQKAPFCQTATQRANARLHGFLGRFVRSIYLSLRERPVSNLERDRSNVDTFNVPLDLRYYVAFCFETKAS